MLPIGTVVRILSEESIRQRLGHKDVCPTSNVTFNFTNMSSYCDRPATIRGYYDRIDSTYFLSVNGIDNAYLWSHQWILPLNHFNDELFTI